MLLAGVSANLADACVEVLVLAPNPVVFPCLVVKHVLLQCANCCPSKFKFLTQSEQASHQSISLDSMCTADCLTSVRELNPLSGLKSCSQADLQQLNNGDASIRSAVGDVLRRHRWLLTLEGRLRQGEAYVTRNQSVEVMNTRKRTSTSLLKRDLPHEAHQALRQTAIMLLRWIPLAANVNTDRLAIFSMWTFVHWLWRSKLDLKSGI